MSVNKKLIKPLILDSALGTELENRGEYLPSFKTSIWSAHCLIHKPEVIKQRLREHEKQVGPVIKHFDEQLINIKAEGAEPEVIANKIIKRIER